MQRLSASTKSGEDSWPLVSFFWCLRTSGIEHPGLDEEIDGGKNAAEAGVRDIQQCFANESGHFKKGLVTELVAETAQSPD